MVAEEIIWRLRLRLQGDRRQWHNRRFPPAFGLVEEGDYAVVSYNGLGMRCLRGDLVQDTAAGACNLLLSGPSVGTITDPSLLRSLPVIGVNGSPELLAREGRGVDVYVVDDLSYVEQHLDNYLRFARLAGGVVLNHGIAYELLRRGCTLENAILVDSINAPFRAAAPQRNPGRVVFSRRFADGLKAYGTVAYVALQVAYCLGFRDVRIFGMDLSNAPRFYHEDQPAANHLERDYRDLILRPMEYVGTMVRRQEWSVVNCSPGSRLPERVLPRREPNEVLGAPAPVRWLSREAAPAAIPPAHSLPAAVAF